MKKRGPARVGDRSTAPMPGSQATEATAPDHPVASTLEAMAATKARLKGRDEDHMRRCIQAAAEDTTRLDGQLHVDDRY